jgi:hypothetical protein
VDVIERFEGSVDVGEHAARSRGALAAPDLVGVVVVPFDDLVARTHIVATDVDLLH